MRSLAVLELSHLPHVNDALVSRIWGFLPSLTRLRLNHLPLSDHAFEGLADHPGLRDLEIKNCPYVRLREPFRPHTCLNLRALRLNPPSSKFPMVACFREVQLMAEHMHGLERLVLGVELVPEESWSRVPCALDLRMNRLDSLRHLELYCIHQVTFPKRPWRYLRCLERLVVDKANGFLLAVIEDRDASETARLQLREPAASRLRGSAEHARARGAHSRRAASPRRGGGGKRCGRAPGAPHLAFASGQGVAHLRTHVLRRRS